HLPCAGAMRPILAACLRAWLRSPTESGGGRELLRGVLNGLDDVLVAGTAAEVAGHPIADLLFRRVRDFFEETIGTRNHARRAVTALQAVLLVEALLQRVQRAALLEAFDREHVSVVALHCEYRARFDRHSVEVHGARAAVAGFAADVRSGMSEL